MQVVELLFRRFRAHPRSSLVRAAALAAPHAVLRAWGAGVRVQGASAAPASAGGTHAR